MIALPWAKIVDIAMYKFNKVHKSSIVRFLSRGRRLKMHLRTWTMHPTVLSRSLSNNTHGTLSVYQEFPRRLLKVS